MLCLLAMSFSLVNNLQYSSMLLTTMHSIGSATLFHPVMLLARNFYLHCALASAVDPVVLQEKIKIKLTFLFLFRI